MQKCLNFEESSRYYCIDFRSGADLGGGRGLADASSQGFDPMPTQRVPPLLLFKKSIFGDGPLNFLKAPLAPIYTNFEGERAPKKCDFFVKIFQKVYKNGFF